MLIRGAEIHGHGTADLRIAGDRIAAIGALEALENEPVVEAHGNLLLPGLHDHHIHLAGLAAQRVSVDCGAPDITDQDALRRALDRPGSGWLRATGFHESVMGGALPDVATLDALAPDRPLRMQHRTGRMWFLNSAALDILLATAPPPPGLERGAEGFTGRLFDEDGWLQQALGALPPDFAPVSAELARQGVTGITDMTPRNDASIARHFSQQFACGALRQHPVLAGSLALAADEPGTWRRGPAKLHLHEAALPDFETTLAFIEAAHAQRRGVAVHCVSEVELVFALALFESAGSRFGDRIEHVSVASKDLVARMADLGLWACVQPHFIAQRGDHYLAEVDPHHHPDLYRLATLRQAGIAMAGGSDAPYGMTSPWQAMASAVARSAASGVIIGAGEALSPEQALALYLADPLDFSRERRIAVGEMADLCLLDRPWRSARENLAAVSVARTWLSGTLVHGA